MVYIECIGREYDVNFGNLWNLQHNVLLSIRDGIVGSFDWLSVTFNCFGYVYDDSLSRPILDKTSQVKIKDILKLFNREDESLDNFEKETGTRGFKYKITIQEGAQILFCGPVTVNGANATQLNLSGTACQWLIARGKFIELIRYVLDYGYNFTRFDATIDNFTDVFDLETINYSVVNKHYVSMFKKPFRITGEPNPDSPYGYDGVTYYLGNSDLLLRIYAKNWEQERQDEIKNWIRWEIQIRDHERIKQLLIMILIGYSNNNYKNYFGIVAGLLKEIVMFKTPTEDSNKSRWPDDPYYLEFLNGVESIKLFKAPKSKGAFEITKNWFEKSCSLFLTQLAIIYGEKKLIRFIKYLIIQRYCDLEANDWNLIINEYENMKKEINKLEIGEMINKFQSEVDILEFNKGLKVTEEAEEYFKRLEEEEKNE